MSVIDPTAFAVLLWGSILGVAVVSCDECYAVGRDLGWFE